jgi:hypothetical protein
VGAVFAFFACGIGARISAQGQEAFVDHLAAKYRDTTVQGERYVRGLVQKVRFQ